MLLLHEIYSKISILKRIYESLKNSHTLKILVGVNNKLNNELTPIAVTGDTSQLEISLLNSTAIKKTFSKHKKIESSVNT